MEVNFRHEDSTFVPEITTLILVTLVTLLAGCWRYRVYPQLGRKLPPRKLGLPIVGESLSFFKAQKKNLVAEWMKKCTNEYGPIFKTSLIGSNAVIITGQAGNRFIFSDSDSGIACNQPASELNGMESVKVAPLLKKTAFKVTCSLLYALSEGKEKDALLENFAIALKGIRCVPLNFPGTLYRKSSIARARIRNLFTQLIARKRRELEEGKVSSHEDIISTLVSLRDEDGKPLLEEEIIDNLITLMIASHDTIAILLIHFVRLLARDAEICDKVLQEQKKVVKASEGSGGKLSRREVQMMKYTWSVAQEIMRLTPPVIGNFRRAWRDTRFDGFDIPKGWQVLWVTSDTHLDDKIFAEPEKIDPSRFQTLTKSMPPYTYIPFGAGQRICPGAEFARVEALLIIHYLITTYRWTEEIPDEPMIADPIPYPAMGLPVKLYSRNNI
ncbi:hypothetical protein Pint_01333 [Pistacia integerrima]|uniref:Uncharacterized protein n=1 Tax=Pistacia integerrima TaxID=434235 RepID=A0ACC0ZHQ6_9ROSI|nr:hypothetical protein Pint_01333 [Pistacia integerrima]